MYLGGFFVVYLLLKYRIERGEFFQISNLGVGSVSPDLNRNGSEKSALKNRSVQIRRFKPTKKFQSDFLLNFLIYVFIGLLIGARLGYVLFYDLKYFLENPLAVVSPFNVAGEFVGIYGMSYHGGLLGALLLGWIFCKKRGINFVQMADFVVPAVPAGYFFGRLGNFLNGELYGRATQKWWGMYFPSDISGILRHPSQLYEAFLEGIILFLILWSARSRLKLKGQLLGLYIIGYSFFRIICEFFREPDPQIGYLFGFLTLGQILSFFGLILGGYLAIKKTKNVL
jgi:phosphatidylglycerol---prolipoprotein diacylglyceryl transferase